MLTGKVVLFWKTTMGEVPRSALLRQDRRGDLQGERKGRPMSLITSKRKRKKSGSPAPRQGAMLRLQTRELTTGPVVELEEKTTHKSGNRVSTIRRTTYLDLSVGSLSLKVRSGCYGAAFSLRSTALSRERRRLTGSESQVAHCDVVG
jgi:hypothetical protein